MDQAQKNQIHQWLKEIFDFLGESQLYSALKVEFSSRFNRRLGDARRNSVTGATCVRFSVRWWAIIDDVQRHETVVHEACHIVDMVRGGSKANGPHGSSWKELMRRCGVPAERCAKGVKRPAEMKNKVQRHEAKCSCRTLSITSHRRTKMLNGKTYRCLRCNQNLVLSK